MREGVKEAYNICERVRMKLVIHLLIFVWWGGWKSECRGFLAHSSRSTGEAFIRVHTKCLAEVIGVSYAWTAVELACAVGSILLTLRGSCGK